MADIPKSILVKTSPKRFEEFKEALEGQPHFATVKSFFEACMDAAIRAKKKGEMIILPMEIKTKKP